MKSARKFTSWYEYRQLHDLFEIDDDTLAKAKKKWRRLYQNTWNAQKRAKGETIKVWFSKEDAKLIAEESRRMNVPKTTLIRTVLRAHVNNSVVIPDPVTLRKIMQLLGMCLNDILDMKREKSTPYDIELFSLRLGELEKQFMHIYHNPPRLLDALNVQIRNDPEFELKLRDFINADAHSKDTFP